MKKTIYILSILSALVFNSSFAQKAKASSAIKKYENLSYIESRNQLLVLANKADASPEVIEKLANAFYFNSEMKDASGWYKKLMDLNIQLAPENYFRYAQSLKAQEKYKDADKAFKNFAALRPEDSRVREFLSKQDYVEAIDVMSSDFELLN